MQRFKRAYSLIELLVCVVIIMILTSISVVSYQGAVDHADLKIALPNITRTLNDYRNRAVAERAVVTVEFAEGQAQMKVTVKSSTLAQTDNIDLTTHGLLRRKLVFRDYKWSDGARTPRTFTFIPNSAPKGGTVWFGSGFAEGRLLIDGNDVVYALQ